MRLAPLASIASAFALAAAPAAAQLRLPGLPQLPALPAPVPRAADSALAPLNLAELRAGTIDQLLRRHPRELQRDPRGEPVVRGEILALPSDAATRDAITAAGFTLLREQALDGLDERWWVLAPPTGSTLEAALQRLRRLDPAGQYDYHHIYTGSGATGGDGAAAALAPAEAPPGARVGLVDGGIDTTHPALRAAALRTQGCGGAPHPSAHGTAVASLLVGRAERFSGALPGAALWAADVYCDAPTGGSVEAIAQALAWLARERVAVVNVSLVGPPNALLQRAVAALVARGHVIVAAVGNDGPAAPPLYPAAWPGVVAVTATDARRRVLPEAGRGEHVAFAAAGAGFSAASRMNGDGGGPPYEPVRGTSFAAPMVAALLAARLQQPDPAAALRAVSALAQAAIDLGVPGRDSVFGWGLVGTR